MAIPYLGSKRKSAGMIYKSISNLNPEAEGKKDVKDEPYLYQRIFCTR